MVYIIAVLFEKVNCFCFVEFERNNVIRFEFPGKSSRDKGRGSAECTECRCGILIGYDLGTAGVAYDLDSLSVFFADLDSSVLIFFVINKTE